MSVLPASDPATLFRLPVLKGLIDRFAPQATPFTSHYGGGFRATADDVVDTNSDVGEFVYDVIAPDRKAAEFTAPYSGPTKLQQRPTKTERGNVMRVDAYHEFRYDNYSRFRRLGGGVGDLDQNGQSRIAYDVNSQLQRMANLHEWVMTSMFRGALHLKVQPNGGLGVLPDATGADITITHPLPAEHTGQLPLGSGGANLIALSFTNANADIPAYIRNIAAEAPRLSGTTITDFWISTKIANAMFNNAQMQAQGGSSFRVFDSMGTVTPTNVEPVNIGTAVRRLAMKGYDTVSWRAFGENYRFHICDYGQQFGGGDLVNEAPARAQYVRYIGENDMLITPPPQRNLWWKKVEASQMISRSERAAPTLVTGFDQMIYPMGGLFQTPGQAVRFLDCFFYHLYIERAIFRPTVIF